MARRVRLNRLVPTKVDLNNYGAIRLRVEVTEVEGTDLDKYLFIYRKGTPSPYSDISNDVFEGIVGPYQLATYPVLDANPDMGWPYFRLDYIEVDCISNSQADSLWEEIQTQIGILVKAMNQLEKLQSVEDVWLPSAPDSSASESSSSSSSSSRNKSRKS